ncbi:solute carrier family 43 member 3-like isoform X2 [Acanthaster planci]|uniref:Solute carrier family 43 member 3-like isoform X2 n=1 Tax=Acanthaster planci TaxID=133434 RepID=A0A8B7ZVW6_ACAPL|nr:solute carrier family 43 member 3-like isoform X2 [Acanthaster planci]
MKMFTRRVRKVSLLLVGALECLCFGGWIFGWASLVFVFKQEKYFADKCQSLGSTGEPPVATVTASSSSTVTHANYTEGPCAEQDAELQLVFTVANFSVSGAALPLGLLYDKMGTLFMRITISILMLTGSLMFALSFISPILVFPAAICVAAGGVQLLVVNLQISNLFGRNKWIVMTLFCGCFDSSAWVFLVVKVLYENLNIRVQTSFFILTGTTLFFTLNTLLLPKKASIPWPLPPDYFDNHVSGKTLNIHVDEPLHVYTNTTTDNEGEYYPKSEDTERAEKTGQIQVEKHENNDLEHCSGECDDGSPTRVEVETHDNSSITLPSNTQINSVSTDFPSLRSCILSPLFAFFYFWFSILQLDVLFFVSTLNPVLNKLANNNEQIVSAYTNALAFIQLGGILCAPFSGLILSRNKRRNRCKNRQMEEERLRERGPYSDLRDAAIAYATCTSICLVFCICGVLPVLEIQYATFVLSVISRSFVYSLTASGTSLFFQPPAVPTLHYHTEASE